MQVCTMEIVGEHANLASGEEVTDGLAQASNVFAEAEADPAACAAAYAKLMNDELLTKEEALLSMIWEKADEAAFRAVTLGWLMRGDVDVRLAIK